MMGDTGCHIGKRNESDVPRGFSGNQYWHPFPRVIRPDPCRVIAMVCRKDQAIPIPQMRQDVLSQRVVKPFEMGGIACRVAAVAI